MHILTTGRVNMHIFSPIFPSSSSTSRLWSLLGSAKAKPRLQPRQAKSQAKTRARQDKTREDMIQKSEVKASDKRQTVLRKVWGRGQLVFDAMSLLWLGLGVVFFSRQKTSKQTKDDAADNFINRHLKCYK